MTSAEPPRAVAAEPDIALNRRGLLAPAQARIVDAFGLGSFGAGDMLPLLAVFPIGALLFVSLIALLFVPWVGVVVFIVLALPTALVVKLLVESGKKEKAARPALPPGKLVRTADGFVAWFQGTWRAFESSPGGPRSIADVMLPPGPFRFYVFNQFVVGAESPLGPGCYSVGDTVMDFGLSRSSGVTTALPVPVGDHAAYAQGLAAGVGFKSEELEANRRGARSSRQGPGRVAVLDGTIQLGWVMVSKFSAAKSIVIEKARFSANDAEYRVIVPGLRYRVYFDPERMRILSLEAT